MENTGILSFIHNQTAQLITGGILFVVSFAGVLILYRYIVKKLSVTAGESDSRVDDFVVEVLRLPFLSLLAWIAVRIFSQTILDDTRFLTPVNHALRILLIVTIGWILIKLTRVLFYYLQKKVEEETPDRYELRGSLTKFSIFRRIIIGFIILVIVAVSLMTFEKIRTVGVSLLTSAGIAGIIIGFAAQKSLGMILAGIQIAITQPIKLNDLVVIDGQNGRIEEINLTYVVVNLWDRRRLVVPINYFLEQNFENWTRHSSDIIGAVLIYADYGIPIGALKSHLDTVVRASEDWDGNTCSIEVNNLMERSVELRVLVSSSDAARSNNLQGTIREEMLAFITREYPQHLTQTRINIINGDTGGAGTENNGR